MAQADESNVLASTNFFIFFNALARCGNVLSLAEYRIFTHLVSYANKKQATWVAYPSYSTIQKETGCHPTTITKTLKSLVLKGLLVIHKNSGSKSQTYWIYPGKCTELLTKEKGATTQSKTANTTKELIKPHVEETRKQDIPTKPKVVPLETEKNMEQLKPKENSPVSEKEKKSATLPKDLEESLRNIMLMSQEREEKKRIEKEKTIQTTCSKQAEHLFSPSNSPDFRLLSTSESYHKKESDKKIINHESNQTDQKTKSPKHPEMVMTMINDHYLHTEKNDSGTQKRYVPDFDEKLMDILAWQQCLIERLKMKSSVAMDICRRYDTNLIREAYTRTEAMILGGKVRNSAGYFTRVLTNMAKETENAIQ